MTVTAVDTFAVVNEKGGSTFIAPATKRCPKLYAFADDDKLLYIGQTVQSMGARMRLGFQADDTGVDCGYRWRHTLKDHLERKRDGENRSNRCIQRIIAVGTVFATATGIGAAIDASHSSNSQLAEIQKQTPLG